MKNRWFFLHGTTTPLSIPSSIPGIEKVVFQPFDVFLHTYHPPSGHSVQEPIRQLWVWELLQSPGLSAAHSWKSVVPGYICPGPGGLQGRHLVVTDRGEPAWVTGSTRYRRYKDNKAGETVVRALYLVEQTSLG